MICVCTLEQVGKYRAAPYPGAVRVWYDNKRFACSYCVRPGLLWGYEEPGREWRGENGEQTSESGTISITAHYEQNAGSIFKKASSPDSYRSRVFFQSNFLWI